MIYLILWFLSGLLVPLIIAPEDKMSVRFEYRAQVINGNFFDVAQAMNNDLSFQGWELIQIQNVNSFHCVAMLKRPVIMEPFQHINGVQNG